MSDWLPGCTRQDWGTSGGAWAREPAIIVVHSTEGTSWPSYDGGQSAPHFTIDLETGERRQHISMGQAARALANASGGVETNRAGGIQIEVIGTCDPNHRGDAGWLFLPTMSDAQAATLGQLLREIADDQGIEWRSEVEFIAYPASYGTGAAQRLSGSQWNSYRGILGHQHVPENDHGDPGNLDMALIMGADMPLSDDDIRRIWAYPNTVDGETHSMGELIRWTYVEARDNAEKVWGAMTTSPIDASAQTALTILRWAYGEAAKAAEAVGVKGRHHGGEEE